ncbi:hypothetical protein AKJ56_01300 [candidate division MSBL1 archaeon SCGC-AAA382N08]|uniref:CN hydrolase domain-containing protein n=1 Tax=candidate division MSBL1 archaeon SCGC-AAA382N08 TaxID=1698285 RepID=A0A133VPT4_9EURY|nr:hypothetical protein AKJ56_01300 [candidate division MSBL1 archaeon SCGC-AAA382N08]
MKLISKILLLVISIILFIIPTYKVSFGIWFCFFPILYLITKSSPKEYLIYAILFSLITTYNLYWIKDYQTKAFFEAAGIWFFYLLVILLISKLIYEKLGNNLIFVFTPPVFYALFQHIHINSLEPFWLNIGFVQSNSAPLIWYIGGVGITFLILLFGSLLASFFSQKKKWKLVLIVFLVIIVMSSLLFSSLKNYDSDEKIKVGIVQLKNRRSWKWRVEHTDLLIERYKELTLSLRNFNPDLVVWPEYAIPADVYNNEELKRKIALISKDLNCTLVIGSLEWGKGRNHTDNVLVFNKGKLVGKQDALVVFPTDPTDPIALEGSTKKLFRTDKGNFTVNLCYEEVTSRVVRKKTSEANYLIFMSNNQDMFSEKSKYLSSLYSKLRSAENKRFGIRSSNHGYSQLISPTGKVIIRTKEQILKGEIPLIELKRSFYSKYGNLIINLIILLYFISLVNKVWLKKHKFS